jgi:hypothetical protein
VQVQVQVVCLRSIINNSNNSSNSNNSNNRIMEQRNKEVL